MDADAKLARNALRLLTLLLSSSGGETKNIFDNFVEVAGAGRGDLLLMALV